jgi:predicted nucleic acid-binding protein
MASSKLLVLDANILIRAVLGSKVRELLLTFNDAVQFFTADICVDDVEKYLPIILDKRQLPVQPALKLFSDLKCLFQIVDKSIYQEYSVRAQQRIKIRDIRDWPVVAIALMLDSAIWTEDQDFFGTGLAVWTTDRIHLFFDSIST